MKYHQYKSMMKAASTVSDVVVGGVPSMVPYIGGLANLAGDTVGWAMPGGGSDKQISEMNNSPMLSLIPGVGAYRLTRRAKREMKDSKGGSKRLTSHYLGTGLSTLIGAIAGGAIGNYLNPGGRRTEYIAAGAAIGAGAPILLASALAVVTPTRTKEEQQRANDSEAGAVADFLVPGVSTYNWWKTLGRANETDIELEKKRNKRK